MFPGPVFSLLRGRTISTCNGQPSGVLQGRAAGGATRRGSPLTGHGMEEPLILPPGKEYPSELNVFPSNHKEHCVLTDSQRSVPAQLELRIPSQREALRRRRQMPDPVR